MFDTDPLAVLVIVLFVAIPVLVIWRIVRRDPAVPTLKRRRPSDPQAGLSVANGTGSERGARRSTAADLAVLPRSPNTPVATSAPRPGVVTGLHPTRATVHG
jgi:hypothetical protein